MKRNQKQNKLGRGDKRLEKRAKNHNGGWEKEGGRPIMVIMSSLAGWGMNCQGDRFTYQPTSKGKEI